MKPVKTSLWDSAEYLETEEDILLYLEEVFRIGDPALIITAIGDAARSRGMAKNADEANRERESLYQSLFSEGNPSFETILKVLSVGLRPVRPPAGLEKTLPAVWKSRRQSSGSEYL